jgi:hypothetical protein
MLGGRESYLEPAIHIPESVLIHSMSENSGGKDRHLAYSRKKWGNRKNAPLKLTNCRIIL